MVLKNTHIHARAYADIRMHAYACTHTHTKNIMHVYCSINNYLNLKDEFLCILYV